MKCPYCVRPVEGRPADCPHCDADLSIDPTRRGLATLAALVVGYALVAAMAYGWCYRPTGWLHSTVDPLVRGRPHEAGRAERGDRFDEFVYQVVLPAVPLGVLSLGLLRGWRGTRRIEPG